MNRRAIIACAAVATLVIVGLFVAAFATVSRTPERMRQLGSDSYYDQVMADHR